MNSKTFVVIRFEDGLEIILNKNFIISVQTRIDKDGITAIVYSQNSDPITLQGDIARKLLFDIKNC
jgi:hypothetical protein